ncbi:transcription termination factor MTERF2, chloroplastic-like [Nymphaea colorata]|nr:transcription termination factor MTERF2, chloroplastic-like [Nymphaea colorata]
MAATDVLHASHWAEVWFFPQLSSSILTRRSPAFNLNLKLLQLPSFTNTPRSRASSSLLCRRYSDFDSPLEARITGDDESAALLRKQNSRSLAVLLDPLSLPEAAREEDQDGGGSITSISSKDRIDEEGLRLALGGDDESRAPVFPGSISLSRRPTIEELLPRHGGKEEKMLRQALELRRHAAREVLIASMRASRFSITYSTNLVSHLAEFVDGLIMEAASMKMTPQFSHSTFNSRVKACIEKCGVVPLIRWLKHNSLTYPQIGKLICLSGGDLEGLRQRVRWLTYVHVKGRNIGVVLTRADSALNRSLHELNDNVDYLEANGVKRDWMGFVIGRCPQILTLNMDELKARVNFYLDLGMDQKDFGTMVFDYPKAIGFFSLEEMNEKVGYLKEFGLETEELGRLLAFKPQLMGCSIEDKWKPLVKYFYYLGIKRDGMKRILMMKPMIFCVDLESTIAPKVRFLRDIGVEEDAIGGVIVRFPALLTYSLYKKIRPAVVFLITKAGVSRQEIGKVIAVEPQLVGCSVANKLEVNVKYFLSLGIPLRLLGEMIIDFPMLLKYNLDVLRPKYRYLRQTMVRPLHDLIEFPRFFSYSLEGRIVPRHKIMVANRITFKLRYMLASTDEEFDRRVETALEKRRNFESGLAGDDGTNNKAN